MNQKAVLKNPTFLDTGPISEIVWIDIYSRSFESIPNFRNDKLFFLQIVNDGYRLLIKFNPLTSNTHISTDVFEMLVKPFEESLSFIHLYVCNLRLHQSWNAIRYDVLEMFRWFEQDIKLVR